MIDHKTICKGDILKAPSGLLRVVRDVQRYTGHHDHYRRNPARSVWCKFVIQRCSWTTRPYTLYNVGEMNQMKWAHTGKRFSLHSRFDQMLAADFAAPNAEQCQFHCCDVEGIA